MKIAQITAGAAGMYCGSCLRDNTLAGALLAEGHDVALIPTYTPLRTDEPDVSLPRIFYGAVNVYLQQKLPFFRRTSRRIDRLFDRPALLDWVSRFRSATDPRDLGALTLSILQGEKGHQRKELERLVEWLEAFAPEIVLLPNAMFLGLATPIRRRLQVPVVSALTGEDLFLDQLPEPYRTEVTHELRHLARETDGLMATSRYYAAVMTDRLKVEPAKMHVVPLGINLSDIVPRAEDAQATDRIIIGYLARICPEKGLHLLVDTFGELREGSNGERFRLEVAGYLDSRDVAYLDGIQQRVRQHGLEEAVTFHGEVDRQQKLSFLGGIDILSVPTTYQEPKGLFVLEALAAGVPVVQPRHGAFPELLEATGGGLLVEPDSSMALAEGIRALADDPERRRELGRKGRSAVEDSFTSRHMARRTVEVLEATLAESGP